MPHGIRISKERAQTFMNQYLEIARRRRGDVAQFCLNKSDNEAANYYLANTGGNPINCFIFDREFIQNFLDNGASHLLVFNGANPGMDGVTEIGDDQSAGEQTLILVGCTMRMEGGREVYSSLLALRDLPAVEHPPTYYYERFPEEPAIRLAMAKDDNIMEFRTGTIDK